MPLGMEVGLGPGDFVLDGDPALLPKKGRSPQFLAHVYCGQTAGWIKITLITVVGLGPGDTVLDGDPLRSPPKKGHSPPQFSAHVCCGQTAEWIKMPLGAEVGLSIGDIVLDRNQLPSPKGTRPQPIFGPCMLWPNGWMDEDATWYESRPRPRPHCVRRGPSSPRERSTTVPVFSAHVY